MIALRNILIVAMLNSATAIAAPASDGTIRQLFTVTQSQKLLETTRAQIDSIVADSIQQELKGKTPTAGQQQVIAILKRKMDAFMQSELAWKKTEAEYLRLYKETFTEEEIVSMLSFYQTPAGQALVNKMPLLMQNLTVVVQQTVLRAAPKMQKILGDFRTEMKVVSN